MASLHLQPHVPRVHIGAGSAGTLPVVSAVLYRIIAMLQEFHRPLFGVVYYEVIFRTPPPSLERLLSQIPINQGNRPQ